MELQRLKEIGIEMMMQFGEAPNTIFVQTSKKLMILPVPLTDPDLKHQHMMIAGMVAAKVLGNATSAVTGVGFVTEAWMSRYQMSAVKDVESLPAPSQDPNRIECLLMATVSISTRETKVCMVEIKRHGKTLELVDAPENEDGDKFQADILDAFVDGLLEGMK